MTLVQLSNFIRVVEQKSLSKAAAVVRIAQPALSRQIRHLEVELGSPLLVRHAWGVSVTPAGEILFERARRLLSEAESARDAVQALAAEPNGRVSLAVPSSLAVSLLPPLATVITRRYPLLKPYFTDGFSASIHQRALGGDLDLAILYEDRAIGPLETKFFLSDDLMLVGRASEDVMEKSTIDKLACRRLIAPARPNRLRLILDEALSRAGASNVNITDVDSLPGIIRMVELGVGWTVLPFSAVAREAAERRLSVWPLEQPPLTRTLVLARPLGRNPSPGAVALEAEMFAQVSSLASPMRWRPIAPSE